MQHMKKRISLLLTLLLLLNCVPIGAFAAVSQDYSAKFEIKRTAEQSYNGQDVAKFSFVANANGKNVGNVSSLLVAYDPSVFELLNKGAKKQNVTQDGWSVNIGNAVGVSTYEDENYNAFIAMAYARLSDDDSVGYLMLQPTLTAAGTPISNDTALMSVYFGLAEDASWDAIPTNAIRLATIEERIKLNQSGIVILNDGDKTNYIYGAANGDDTLAEPKMEAVGYTPVKAPYTGTEASAPTVSNKQGGTVTLDTNAEISGESVEYGWSASEDTQPASWQDDVKFDGLDAGTVYFWARVKENDLHQASAAVASEAVTIYAAPTVAYGAVTGTVNTEISVSPQISGGAPAGAYEITEGTLPSGLSLVKDTGVISGTPTVGGSGSVTVTYTDGEGQTAAAVVTYDISKMAVTTGKLTYDLSEVDYNGSEQPVAVTAKESGMGAITVKYNGSTAAPKDAGTYDVTVDVEDSDLFNGVEGLSLGQYTIAPVQLTAGDLEYTGPAITKTYDSTTACAVSAGVTVKDGVLKGNDSLTLTVTGAVYSAKDVASANQVTLTVAGISAGNYRLPDNTQVTADAVITPADYTANSTEKQNVVVGVGTFSEPTFTGVNGETVTGALNYTYDGATKTYGEVKAALAALSKGNTATIDWSFTANDNNYVSAAKNGSINVTMVDIQIEWPVVNLKANPTYGDTWAEIVTFTGGSANLNGTDVPGTFTLVNTGAPNAGEGQTYSLNFKSTDGKYDVTSTPAGDIAVAPKAITVTVNPASREYGAANPTFDFTVPDGALEGQDTKDGLGVTLSTEAAEASAVGSYDVTGTATNANYKVTVSGEDALTITKADITGFQTKAPSHTVLANNAANKSAADLKAIANSGAALPETVTVTYGDGKTAELSINWADAAETFNAKGGTYTYKGTVVPGDNFNAYADTLNAAVTVTPVTGTISWNVIALTKAKSEIDSAASITDVLGVGTVAVTYDSAVSDGPYTITGSEPTLETLKGYDVSAGDQVVEVVPTVVFPAWATITNADVLKTTLTITEKYPVKVTFTTEPASVTYGVALTPPVAEQSDLGNGTDASATFTYTYVGVDGTVYGPSTTAPTEAGTYQVTAALVSDTYSGSATSAKFTIDPKEVTLTWSGYENLTYDGTAKNVTAAADGLESGDECTVTVTGGTETAAGDYTATATALSNTNYKLPAVATQAYTIAKADRNLTVTPADLLLYPGSLTGQITASTSTDLDKSAVITYTSGSTSTVTVNGSGKVTAVANGKTTVTVAIAETDNYNAAESKTVTVTALPKPLTDVSVSSDTSTDMLTAEVTDGKIVVSGIKADESKLMVTPITAAVEGVTIDSEVTESTLTIKVGETVIATYAIDLSHVTKVDADVALEDEAKSSANEVEGENAADAGNAISDPATKTDGLVESAAKALNDAAQVLAESKKAEIEAAFGADTAYTLKVEPSVKFTAKVLDDNTFRLAIEPVYTVTAVKTDDGDELELAADVAMPNGALTTPVTISIKLPDGFPTANLFARHFLSGGTEILRVDVHNGVASWKQSSFSEVELFADARSGAIQFNFADGTQETKRYDAADLNSALPVDSKDGYTFQGWTIGGKNYTILTEELLNALAGTVIAESTFQANSSSDSSSGSSTSVTQYTITVKQSDGGKIAPETVKVKKGADQTFTITADEGYSIADVLVDGKSVGAVSTYTFENVVKSHTIQAVFEQQEAPAFQFSDVDANGWAAESIYFLYDRGVVSGVGDSLFAPGRSITRAEFVRMLAGLFGVTAEELNGKTTSFTDVVSGSWYEPYVAWAVENGVTSGTSETTFAPNANITREQMATMIYRYAGNVDFALPETEPAVTFSDASSFSGWAVDAIGAMQRAGIISGLGDNRFAPADNATREQACRMLAVFLQLMES